MTLSNDNFFHHHRPLLTSQHPGLTPRLLQQSLEGLSAEKTAQLQGQLLQGLPLAYATNSRFFYRAEFYVDSRVLIPRMESELFFELLRTHWHSHYQTLVDVGTGSGALGLCAAMEFSTLQKIVLTDLSPQALEVATLNRDKLTYRLPPHCRIELQHGSCLQSLPAADVIIANPPYIKRSELSQVHPQVCRYEPPEALFIDDAHYLSWYRKFFRQVCGAITGGGLLVMEGHERHLPQLAALLGDFPPVKQVELARDLAGKTRFLWAQFNPIPPQHG